MERRPWGFPQQAPSNALNVKGSKIDWGGVALAGAGIITGALGVREARKNREWQERMSNTAHQREVADLQAAGLNPALSIMRGGGASTPQGSEADWGGIPKNVVAALQVRQARAQIDLTQAQAHQAASAGALSRTQAADIATTAQDRYRVLSSQAASGELSYEQAKQMMPALIAEAQQKVRHTAASAKQMEALAVLTQLERQGYVNAAEFEKHVGAMGPAGKYLLEILRSVSVAPGGKVLLDAMRPKGRGRK